MTDLTPDGDLTDPYRNFIAKSRYSRWLPEMNRRETWAEAVDRYFTYMVKSLADKHGYIPDPDLVRELQDAVLHHEIMPSMRALMTAGEALDRSNIAGYNCAYLPLQDPEALDELLYVLMNGTGVGYSVERRYVSRLPAVPEINATDGITVLVGDSKEGWAFAFRSLLSALWSGIEPTWDLSQVRPAGAPLATFGGRASGPEPLRELFEYTVEVFRHAQGRRLRPIEIHDLACKIASVVVVGGVRRSAMICLSDLDDEEMAIAKSGEWWSLHPHRALANISAVYDDTVAEEEFAPEWIAIRNSGSGERGIFNRDAARRQASRFGMRRDADIEYGTNPCSEIILRPFSFCNLSEVVARPEDNVETLKRKVRLAAVLGTWQSTLTEFPYLRREWRDNAEDERLLGVSLTGIFDNPILNGSIGEPLIDLPAVLVELADEATESNRLEAGRLDIAQSAAVTCVKPSGTVSQLVDSASGLHPRHARYYIRRVRVDKTDPLAQLMVDSGVPHTEDAVNPAAWVMSFPQRASDDAVTREDVTSIQHLDLWLMYQRYWCDHKPSVTISVRPDEWDEVGAWVWRHIDEVAGVAFLPYEDHVYQQAPYEACVRVEYEDLLARMPNVQWADLPFYERADRTAGAQELACSASGGCEVVDLVSAS